MDYVYSFYNSPSMFIYWFCGLIKSAVIVIGLKLLEKIHLLLFFLKFLKTPNNNIVDIFHNFKELWFPKSQLFLDFLLIEREWKWSIWIFIKTRE